MRFEWPVFGAFLKNPFSRPEKLLLLATQKFYKKRQKSHFYKNVGFAKIRLIRHSLFKSFKRL